MQCYSRALQHRPVPVLPRYLLLDVHGRALCRLQVLHQRCVPQEVPRGGGEPGEQGVLQLLQVDLELILAFCEICLHTAPRRGVSHELW